MTTQLVKAELTAKADPTGKACPNCGRRYLELLWPANAKTPSYRCVGIGREGGCGAVFTASEARK